jgi:hypothetical protein
MRVKKLVTTRMDRIKATGKGEKRKKKEKAKPMESEWSYSKCSRNDLSHLVKEGLLQEQHLVQWCLHSVSLILARM